MKAGTFSSLLLLLFVGLKLTGHITWSWWWVLSPLWIQILVVIMLLVIYVIVSILSD